jgi:hypothetical protein
MPVERHTFSVIPANVPKGMVVLGSAGSQHQTASPRPPTTPQTPAKRPPSGPRQRQVQQQQQPAVVRQLPLSVGSFIAPSKTKQNDPNIQEKKKKKKKVAVQWAKP